MQGTYLSDLELVHFRNYRSLKVQPNPRFNTISGSNGMGKTNLLEAIYFCGALRSFRTSTRNEVLTHGTENSRIRGIFKGASVGLRVEVLLTDGSRRIRVDEKPVQAGSGHFRNLPMVLFHPTTMALVQGGPDARRRFLDRALFQAEPLYPVLFRDYGKALSNRNRLLKSPSVDRRALIAFDEQLAELGAQIVVLRETFIETLRPLFVEAFGSISIGLSGEIAYLPKFSGDSKMMREALEKRLPADIARGFTSVGPHGDDMDIVIDGRSARKFASQGQQRMIALSLKIAETTVLALATQRIPILLLDDVSSELDRDRNRQLFRFLAGVGGQVFITTTHPDHILIEEHRSDFVVEDGTLEPL